MEFDPLFDSELPAKVEQVQPVLVQPAQVEPEQIETAQVEPERKDTISSFQAKIDHATIEQQEWVETSEPIIRYFNRTTLCPKGKDGKESNLPLLMKDGSPFYFIYKNIKVCEFGKYEEIEKHQSVSNSERTHGKGEGIVISGNA